jgi:tetratricopeptide (TPR) repeat protein
MRQYLAPALLLALFAGLAIASVRESSVTGDEVAHLPAGYTYVRTGDFRLNPQHPPLVKALAGVPLLLLDLPPVDRFPGWREADEWIFGRAFLTQNRAPMERILLLARLPMVAIGVLLGAVLFLWARDLWGRGAALFVLLLFALCPNILAHTALVTTDVGVSCFSVFTLYALWRLVRGGRRRAAVLCGIGLGLALLAKYTGVVTAGLVPVLVAGAWVLGWSRTGIPDADPVSYPVADPVTDPVADPAADPITDPVASPHVEPPARQRRFTNRFALTPRGALASLGIVAALALLVVALGFGAPSGISNYLDGFSRIYADANPLWEGFLWGEYSSTGFRYYYLLASLWKTPLPTLIAFAIALASISLATPERRIDWLFILVPFAAFHAAGVFNQANIGIRHVLPAYPFMFLACGAAATRLAASGARGKTAIAALSLLLAAGTLRAHPNYLSYFNALVGGPAHGIDYLDDSNVEWGQDYRRLAEWVEKRRPSQLALLAFEPVPPATYGLRYRTIKLDDVTRPKPGVTYVSGAHYLQRNSLFNEWPGVRCEWLHRYQPVEIIGGSFFVYRFSIDPDDAGSPDLIYLPRERWYEDSIAQLTKILERSPRFGLARSLLATDYVERGRWREQQNDPEAALLDFVRAAEVSGSEVEPVRELAVAVHRLRPRVESAALIGPGPYCLEGTYDRARGELGTAAVALLRCIAVRPDDLAARANLGWTFLDLGLAGPARIELERCLAADPTFAPAQAGLEALARLGSIDRERQARALPDPAAARRPSGSPGGASR